MEVGLKMDEKNFRRTHNRMIDGYKKEMDETIAEMNNIRQQIANLDNAGVELAAKANVLSGKIEAMEEFAKKFKLSNVNTSENVSENASTVEGESEVLGDE